MKLQFEKMNGLGNDFVFLYDMDASIELTEEQVEAICDRHFGIGGDGVIQVRPSENPDCAAYMHYINSDGSLAEMCGNGVRCFAKYLVDHKMVDVASGSFVADTKAGPKPIVFETDADGLMTVATVNMGDPILDPVEVPTTLEPNSTYQGIPVVLDAPVESPWGEFRFTCVSMGNPHAVCFIDSFDALPDAVFADTEKSLLTFDIDKVGRYFESHEVFPAKANIEFACFMDDGIHMRVYERGDGETLACGTGTCATNVAAALTGRASRENDVTLLGGLLHIRWSEEGPVFMTGPAQKSFEGTLEV